MLDLQLLRNQLDDVTRRLADAGFAASDMQVIEPFPKKGNLVLRYKGQRMRHPL